MISDPSSKSHFSLAAKIWSILWKTYEFVLFAVVFATNDEIFCRSQRFFALGTNETIWVIVLFSNDRRFSINRNPTFGATSCKLITLIKPLIMYLIIVMSYQKVNLQRTSNPRHHSCPKHGQAFQSNRRPSWTCPQCCCCRWCHFSWARTWSSPMKSGQQSLSQAKKQKQNEFSAGFKSSKGSSKFISQVTSPPPPPMQGHG